jgi:hypothetical protein
VLKKYEHRELREDDDVVAVLAKAAAADAGHAAAALVSDEGMKNRIWDRVVDMARDGRAAEGPRPVGVATRVPSASARLLRGR